MAGQVMEAPALHQQASMLLGQLQANCKNDHHLAVTTAAGAASSSAAATATAAEMAYLQQLQTAAAEANNGGAARGEQCPRCASHDTKFCYYNNYNTSQPRHFCRACRRYWTLGGSLRNVPIGGSTRKRPRLAHPIAPPPASRRQPAHVVFGGDSGAPAAPVPNPSSQSLLGSLFALGAGPLLEGRGGAGFDLGLGLTMPGGTAFGGAGELGAQMQSLGLRGGLGGTSPALLWPAGLLHSDSVDAWKVPGFGAAAGAAMWPEFSAAAAPQAGGLQHGGAQLM